MGKFYEMINDFHDSSKKWDPITHYTLDATHDASTKSVGETGRLFGWDHLTNMANKDKADFGRWGGNTIGAAAAIYGGMSALGGSSGATGASGAEAGGWTAGDTGLMQLSGEGGGTVAQTGLAEPAAGGSWLSQLMDTGSSSLGQGGQGGGQQQGGGAAAAAAPGGYGQPQQGMGGNPALSEALARLVSEQEQTKRTQQNPFMAAINAPQFQQQPSNFDRFLRESQKYQNGGGYGRIS